MIGKQACPNVDQYSKNEVNHIHNHKTERSGRFLSTTNQLTKQRILRQLVESSTLQGHLAVSAKDHNITRKKQLFFLLLLSIQTKWGAFFYFGCFIPKVANWLLENIQYGIYESVILQVQVELTIHTIREHKTSRERFYTGTHSAIGPSNVRQQDLILYC